MYTIEYNGRTSRSVGLYATRPSIPAPQFRIKEHEVSGRDGLLIENDGTIEDIEITVKFGFISRNPNKWNGKFRTVKMWLLQKGNALLRFQDDPAWFYRVKNVMIGTGEREVKEVGEFDVTFLCEGYQYLADGQYEYSLAEILYNPYFKCRPVYKITGNGACVLTVNGEIMTANVGQNLTIDTGLMIAYREDGTMMNTNVSGDYESLCLQNGDNTVSITNGFSLKIIPNWRSY